MFVWFILELIINFSMIITRFNNNMSICAIKCVLLYFELHPHVFELFHLLFNTLAIIY